MPLPGQFAVGQLYNDGYVNGLKVWSQPVPGGLVYPQLPTQFPSQNMGYPQVVMSYQALYYGGCGHPFNSWRIFEVYDPYAAVQVALVTCPLCGFIQEIISPYEAYSSYIDTPLVVA